tara:strand:- start:33933 stop:35768 length:1836 start_codon:yes stop_codon:yes gene_type:complete
MIFEKSTPLLIFPNRFNDFDSYFKSLSRSAKKGLTSTIKKNTDITYKDIPLDIDVLSRFMTLWGYQPLSDGKYPLWGYWTPEWIISLDIDVLMFGSYLNKELISIQFVFKWDNYILCNTPLYDKSLYKDREISKYMWLKLIEWSIDNDMEYLDLMGEGENSWISSIKNRVSSNSPGDFGYKWKFVPDNIKNNLNIKDLRTNSCVDCNYRWIEEIDNPIECKCKKLLIIAHADDEIAFFGNWLELNKHNVCVVCVCSDRKNEFIKSMKHYGIDNYEIWDHKAELDLFEYSDKLKEQITFLKEKHNWNQVVTHSQYGEYGHLQHIELHDIVTQVFNENIYVYNLSEEKTDNNKMDIVSEVYTSEIKGLSEIKNSECTGSDWYKHSVHHNLMDYESVVNYVPTKLNISLQLPNNSYDSYIKDIGNELEKRGHKITYNNTGNIKIGFSINNNKSDILFLLEDISEYDRSILNKFSNTKRIIVGSKNIRNSLGNSLNITYINFFDKWDRLIRNIESNILLSIKWSTLNKINNLFTDINFNNNNNNQLNMNYIGEDIIDSNIKFFDKSGIEIIFYKNDLYKNNKYYFLLENKWKEEYPIFIKVYKENKLIFSQIVYL